MTGELLPITIRDAGLTDDLVDLGIQIGIKVTTYLKGLHVSSPDLQRVVTDDGIAGKFTYQFDVRANSIACEELEKWAHARELIVHPFGEECEQKGQDIRAYIFDQHQRDEGMPDILCLLDAVDGSQHFLHRRNLWCTALSFFVREMRAGQRRSPLSYGLAASIIVDAEQRIFFAREAAASGKGGAFWRELVDGHDRLLQCPTGQHDLSKAEVCSVFRRPDHYDDSMAIGFPKAAGLNSFGGNPMLAALSAPDGYDAVYQVLRSSAGAQRMYDWLPGLHVAERANATVLALDGQKFKVANTANDCVNLGSGETRGYVAARNLKLAKQLVAKLRRKN
jgi:fructose-1,6-bisphosphatase/inositol monophosphatase family enzyme